MSSKRDVACLRETEPNLDKAAWVDDRDISKEDVGGFAHTCLVIRTFYRCYAVCLTSLDSMGRDCWLRLKNQRPKSSSGSTLLGNVAGSFVTRYDFRVSELFLLE